MNGLVAFLTENCCGGASCSPAACQPAAATKGNEDEAPTRSRRRA
jgi:hypothetical protein